MIIKEANREKIDAMIKEAEGRATVRTIDYADIVKALERIEKRLRIKKKDMVGVKANVDIHAQNFPRAYKYRAESTHFFAERKVSGWDLYGIEREWTRREGHEVILTLTDHAKEAIVASCTEF